MSPAQQVIDNDETVVVAKSDDDFAFYPSIGVVPAVLADLAAPTPQAEIKQRVAYGKGGAQYNPDGTPKMLDYVDARYVQDTLDNVVGAANWQSKFEDTPNGTRCGIGIYVAGQWVWKWDVGIPSNIEPVKGAHSDAFKRAAVQWGIARDLYSVVAHEDDDAQAVPEAPATVRQQAGARQARYEQPATPVAAAKPSPDVLQGWADAHGLAWECPIHGGYKIVAPGVSKKPPYRPYDAFFGCAETDPYCDQRGPRVTPA